jgi:hypothetical protein
MQNRPFALLSALLTQHSRFAAGHAFLSANYPLEQHQPTDYAALAL